MAAALWLFVESWVSGGEDGVVSEFRGDVGGVDLLGVSAVDAKGDEADVTGLLRLELNNRSVFSLPTACREGEVSKDMDGVDLLGPAPGKDEDEGAATNPCCRGGSCKIAYRMLSDD